MTTTQADLSVRRTTLVLRVLVAVALAVSAYIHFDLATGPSAVDGKLTLAGLFLGQAVVAAVVALWVLVRPDRLSFAVAALVGLGSFAALILTVYVKVPSILFLPAVYEPIWYSEKVIAAISAGVAGVAALAGLARLGRR